VLQAGLIVSFPLNTFEGRVAMHFLRKETQRVLARAQVICTPSINFLIHLTLFSSFEFVGFYLSLCITCAFIFFVYEYLNTNKQES